MQCHSVLLAYKKLSFWRFTQGIDDYQILCRRSADILTFHSRKSSGVTNNINADSVPLSVLVSYSSMQNTRRSSKWNAAIINAMKYDLSYHDMSKCTP